MIPTSLNIQVCGFFSSRVPCRILPKKTLQNTTQKQKKKKTQNNTVKHNKKQRKTQYKSHNLPFNSLLLFRRNHSDFSRDSDASRLITRFFFIIMYYLVPQFWQRLIYCKEVAILVSQKWIKSDTSTITHPSWKFVVRHNGEKMEQLELEGNKSIRGKN